MLSRYEKALKDQGLSASPTSREFAEALGAHAPALFSLVVADPAILEDVQKRPLDRADESDALAARFAQLHELEDGPELWRELRRARHRAMVRIALREVLRVADIDQTAAELAVLASVAIDAAWSACRNTVEASLGRTDVAATVLGMGKLGGGELNFGSDVDLIFFYETDDAEVHGDASVHEIFTRVVRRTTKALSEVTEDGFAFRVDLRLRPEGSRGALANSLASAERYYASFGRKWERAALLRAQPVAGDHALGHAILQTLQPFIYPRRVDPDVATSMHELMHKARRDLRVADTDIKLGRGGIREAEFFVQSLQLIWGGMHPELRVAGTLDALERLKVRGLVTHQEAQRLSDAWALLRRVEHRIHMSRGYQTHELPRDRTHLAKSLGFDTVDAFDSALADARERVAELFDSLVEAPHSIVSNPLVDALADEADDDALSALLPSRVRDPDAAIAHLRRLARNPQSPFGVVGREQRTGLASRLLEEVGETPDVDGAIQHLADFFAISGSGYDRVLEQQPQVARRLLGLFGTSPTLARALVRHPEALGETILGASSPSSDAMRRAHATLGDVDNAEALVATMRRLKREHTLRVGLAYVDGELDLKAAGTHLTALAVEQVRSAFEFARREAEARWGALGAGMAVVGLGKLGGGEMGFSSDLDLLFVYSDDGETERGDAYREIFARMAQRLIRLLSQPDAAGPGYATDARLRPGGSQGVLVSTLEAFRRYQSEQAQGWEQQALVRAQRIACSDDTLGPRVDALLEESAYGSPPRNPERLADLRARMQQELAGEKTRRYHPKLGHGALVDVELLTQWLQMKHGSVPGARARNTLDALRALESVVDRSVTDALRDAYLFFRGVEQAMTLLDERASTLSFGGPRALSVARAVGLTQRDGDRPDDVLEAMWRRRASETRALFDRFVAPVAAKAPW